MSRNLQHCSVNGSARRLQSMYTERFVSSRFLIFDMQEQSQSKGYVWCFKIRCRERMSSPVQHRNCRIYTTFLYVFRVSEVHCHNMPYGGSNKNSDTYNQNTLEEATRSGPYFDKSASKNVTALLGKTTYLNCRVKNLGNKTVSEKDVNVEKKIRIIFAAFFFNLFISRVSRWFSRIIYKLML